MKDAAAALATGGIGTPYRTVHWVEFAVAATGDLLSIYMLAVVGAKAFSYRRVHTVKEARRAGNAPDEPQGKRQRWPHAVRARCCVARRQAAAHV